jgi:hypothetical protein
MKTKITYSLLAAAAACGFVQAQTTAYTTPVGYITIGIAANGSSADTFISASLVQPTEFAGASSASPSGLTTIIFTGGVPTTFNGLNVLEITEGASEGWWSTVVSSTSTSITISDAFPAGLPAATKISVRKHNTLKSFLGNNAPGLIDYDGENPSDEIQILDASTQQAKSYVWLTPATSETPDGIWFGLLESADATDAVIEPGSAVLVRRIGASPLSFVTSGTVKTTDTQVDVYPSFNWVGTQIAAGSTLNGMGFNTQLNVFDGESLDYDEFQFILPSQVAVPYAAVDDGIGGFTMYNLAESEDAAITSFAEGTGAIIVRTGNPASTLTVPGTVVAP